MMSYLKSFGVGLLLALCGASIWLVWMFAVGLKTSRAVGIDIRSIRSPVFWIPIALLFLIGFFFEFRKLQRGF
jgi:hypothetical protein